MEQYESVLLETNFRQGEGEWTEMLNRIRVGKQTDKDMKKLNDRPYTLLTKEEFDDAIHFFYTNLEVNEHNNYRLNALEDLLEEMQASMIHSKGYKPKINENGLIDSTQFAQKLKLKKSARVMIIANVDIKDGIVNGSLGMVLDFVKTVTKDKDGKEKEEVKAVIVRFDDPETGLDQIARNKFDENLRKFEKDKGVPIFRSNLLYQAPYKKSYKTHNCQVSIKQFPLKLAYASTAHKVQGITIKKGKNVVIHGHRRIPNSMYYLMCSRVQEMEQLYFDMRVKDKNGKYELIDLVIVANPQSLLENEKLVERSIVPNYKTIKYNIFMVNIASLQNKIIDLTKDIVAQASDHVCVVETWLDTNKLYDFDIPQRYVFLKH